MTARSSGRRCRFVLLAAIVFCVWLAVLPGDASAGSKRLLYDDLSSGFQPNFSTVSKWNHPNLTYAFVNGTDDIAGLGEQQAVRDAMALWSAVVPLTFTEVSPSNADIKISWVSGDHGDGYPFDGLNGVLAHAFYPSDGRVHFDDAEGWTTSTRPDASQPIDLVTVAAHELGHALGLAHSSDPSALMYPYYSASHRYLAADDINGIRSLYDALWVSVAPRSSDRALVACLGTKSGAATCSAPLWPSSVNTDAAVTNMADDSVAVAFNGAAGFSQCRVTNFLGANCWSSGAPIATGTSPAVATLTGGAASGTAVAAFNTPSGALHTCQLTSTGPANCANHGWVLASGSSPSVAPLGDGSAAVAFRGASGQLSECRVTSFGGSNCWSSGVSMAAGTKPGVATLTGGAGSGSVVVAFRTPSGALETCRLTSTGPANCANQGWVLASGSSPTVARLSDGSVAVGFNGATGQFGQCRVTWFGGSDCWTSGVAMATGTTPAITLLSTGTAMAAFRTSSGSLGTCELTTTGPTHCADHGWVVAAGSNPSATPFYEPSAMVVFQGASGQLSTCRVTDFGGSDCWGQPQTLAPTTNPGVTNIP